MRFVLPPALEQRRGRDARWDSWLDRAPLLLDQLCEEWSLRPDKARDDELWHGHASVVLPVRDEQGRPGVLKVGYDGDDESVHESLALQRWAGRGAVRMHRADPSRRGLLLERLSREDLSQAWDVTACEVVAGLYGRLHVPAPPQLVRYSDWLSPWIDNLERRQRELPLPRRMVQQAVSLARGFAGEDERVMVHGDLHYGNVLAGDREPWLAIDPRPMAGDPHVEPAPMLWNRWDEVLASHDIRGSVRTRFLTLVDTAMLDEDRARDWVVVRAVVDALWAVEDADRERRVLSLAEQNLITVRLAVAKAVQE